MFSKLLKMLGFQSDARSKTLDLSKVEVAMLVARSHVVKRVAAGAGIHLGNAPYKGTSLDAAWSCIVDHPLPDEDYDWIIGSFGALLIEHFSAQYGFELKELQNEHGNILCLIEKRTGAQVFPFDSLVQRLKEQKSDFFVPYLQGVQDVLSKHGVFPEVPEA
jgi:hypothetical protein